jgi:uncharacterized protein YciI
MADYFLVRRTTGPAWDHDRPRREQHGWDEHAAFMDGLVDEGVIVLGGPVGDANGTDTMAIFDVESEDEVRSRLAEDPWGEDMLMLKSVEPWLVWLRASSASAHSLGRGSLESPGGSPRPATR